MRDMKKKREKKEVSHLVNSVIFGFLALVSFLNPNIGTLVLVGLSIIFAAMWLISDDGWKP